MVDMFERDVHNAIKKLLEARFTIVYNVFELFKEQSVAVYTLYEDGCASSYDTADEAIRAMCHKAEARNEQVKAKKELNDPWKQDYGPLYKDVDFQVLRKYYEHKE